LPKHPHLSADGPRRDRQLAERNAEAAHAEGQDGAAIPAEGAISAEAMGSAEEEASRPPPPEFAAAVRVTDAERAWIREHLATFHENRLITDVLSRVKAGKEATVYVCSAHPSTGRSLVAAKLYRERSLRSSKNAGQYQQGRGMLDEDGSSAEFRSRRLDRAVTKKSKRGKAAVQTSWLMHEFTLLEALRALGADVPAPIERSQQALLMEFIGDEAGAAPTLNDVEIQPGEAKGLFDRVIFNVELLLGLGWIHGDLSPYNILYHQGRITLIDFPQVVDCRNNPRARALFTRDIERVTAYFERFGEVVDPLRLARELWSKHVPASDADVELD
jgi:RIO kinase 1